MWSAVHRAAVIVYGWVARSSNERLLCVYTHKKNIRAAVVMVLQRPAAEYLRRMPGILEGAFVHICNELFTSVVCINVAKFPVSMFLLFSSVPEDRALLETLVHDTFVIYNCSCLLACEAHYTNLLLCSWTILSLYN